MQLIWLDFFSESVLQKDFAEKLMSQKKSFERIFRRKKDNFEDKY